MTGVQLSSWEAVMVRKLSEAYVDQLSKSKIPQCPSPWLHMPVDKLELARGIEAIFTQFQQQRDQGKRPRPRSKARPSQQ